MMRRASTVLVCLLLGACGGGGGGSGEAACAFDASLTASDPACRNDPPSADAGADDITDPNLLVVLDAAGSFDPDGTISAYQWSQLSGPTVSILSPTSAQASFVAPRFPTETDLVFQVRVTDNNATSMTDAVTISVSAATNAPPIADAGADQTATGSQVKTLDGRASTDQDTPLEIFSWEQTAGSPNVQINNSDQMQASFTAPDVAAATDLQFSLTVTDDFGVTDTDEVSVTVLAPTVQDLFGTVTAPLGAVGDSDTNDPRALYISNDTQLLAQAIPTPVTIGGYVNAPGAGEPGRSTTGGDTDDYFAVTLTANATVNMVIADFTTADLDLYLFDELGIVVDSSVGVGQLESVVAPLDGDYFVDVRAFSGASAYNLVTGQAPLTTGGGMHRISADFVPGEAIVKMRDDAGTQSLAEPAAIMSAHGFRIRAGARSRSMLLELDFGADTRIAAAATNGGTVNAPIRRFRDPAARKKWRTLMALKSLARDPDVEFAEPNYLRQPFATPNDPVYSFQWHYPMINLPAAWDLETGSANVTVAVLDTGILAGHPDFQGRIVDGFDFVSDAANAADGGGIDADPNDPGDAGVRSIFHGTHVAGTIGAATNNGAGVAGVAWNVGLLPLRVCGVEGCSLFDQIEAMRYAAGLANSSGSVANPRADIINLSLGGPGFSSAGQAAVNEVRAAGVIVIAAAGNDANSVPLYPAAYNGVVSVSAVGPDRDRAPYSSFGTMVDIAAPGGNLATDINGDGYADGVLSPHADDSSGSPQFEYLFLAGTSMAAPHVAGVAALMKSANANLTPALFDQLLVQGDLTDDIGTPGRDNFFGYGLIDAHKAVSAALTAAGSPPPDNPELAANPLSLNFGSTMTSLQLNVMNSGTGSLQVTSVTTDRPWLQAVAQAADGDGLGTYVVTVDRGALADGVYTGTILLASNVNAVQVPVIMTVGNDLIGGNVGHIYIALVDPVTGSTVSGTEVDFVAGNYVYRVIDVPAGEYRVIAGTDSDNDGFICDDGEVCGEYITRDQPITIEVTADLTGLDFLVNYEVPVNPLAGPANGIRKGIRRQPDTIKSLD